MAHNCEDCEPECKKKVHNIDCFFCECIPSYETNFTCRRCEHDLVYCTCSPEQIKKEMDDLFNLLKSYLR